MTRIIRDTLLVLILATLLILLGGAVLDWLGDRTDGAHELFVWIAWDAGALLIVISLVWLWRRLQRDRSANGNDGAAP